MLDRLVCPRCKTQILLIQDVEKMATVIANHLEIHANELRCENIAESEISTRRKEIENALIQEMIKEICEEQPPPPQLSGQ